MKMYVTINGKDYEFQISAREITNDGNTYAILSDSETQELLFESGLFEEKDVL